MYLPNDETLKKEIIREAYELRLAMHPGSTKMYQDLKEFFWWSNIKKELVKYMARCEIYLHVKVEHQKLVGLLQPLLIPKWKWKNIMDFV
jgi:hypothetical protein